MDWDHDGDLDLWATNRTSPRVQFLRNNADTGGHFLTVRLQGNGTTTNRDAIGARAELILANPKSVDNPREAERIPKSIKTVRAGEGFLSQSSKSLHFGLGKAADIDRMIVHWPGGEVEVFTGLQADRHYTILQGSGKANPWARPKGDIQLADAHREMREPGDEARIQLRYRIPMPVLRYETVEGEIRSLGPRFTTPTLVNLWASWCQPCLKELVEFRKREKQLRAAGVEVIALSVDQLAADESSNPKAARAFLDRQEFPFQAGFATSDFVGKLEAAFLYLFDFRRPWAVPTSILLDRHGQLAVIYIGPVDVVTLQADVEQLSLDNPAWFEASLPFAGRWAGRSRHPNLVALINKFLDQEFIDDGLQLVDKFADVLVGDPEAAPLLTRLALSLNEEGHVVKAKRRFQQAIKANPEDAKSRLQFARFLVQRRQVEDAKRECLEAVRLQPDYADGHFFLANLLNSQGDKEGAVKHFGLAVKLKPDSSQARFALGNAYAGKLQWEKASAQLREAARLDPENAQTHFLLGRVLQKRGLTEEAVGSYERALNLKPDSGDLHYSIGAALALQGQSSEAIRHLRQARQLQPDSLKVLNGLAWIIATADESSAAARAEAVRVAELAASKTNYAHPQILDTLSAAYAAAGKFDKAVPTAERAIKRAKAINKNELADEIQTRLKLYRAGKPYRASASEH